MKKKLTSFLQMAIGLGIIAFLLARMHQRGELGQLAEAVRGGADHWPLLAAGVVFFGGCILACVTRWNVILQEQGVHIPFRHLLTLYFVGHFFNAFLFGACGGDVVKAYYVAKETRHKRTEVVSTVFIDRLLGLLALVLLTVVIMLLRWRFFLSYPQMRLAIVFNLVLLFGAVVFFALGFRRNLFERWRFFRTMEQKTALGNIIARAYQACRLCIRPKVLFKTTILSLINHVTLVVSTFYLGMGLGIEVGFLDYLTVCPIINAISAIPITPGGLGTRESAMIYLFGVLNVPGTTAMVLSLFLYGTVLVWSLAGGVVYMFYSYVRGTLPPASEVEAQAHETN